MTPGSASVACQCRTITYHMYTTFFVPHGQSILPLCESEVKRLGSKVVWPANSPTPALSLSLLICLKLFFFSLIKVQSLESRTGNNIYRFSTCSGAPTSNDPWWLINPQQRGTNSLVRRNYIRPFLDQFIGFFISRYSMTPRCPH